MNFRTFIKQNYNSKISKKEFQQLISELYSNYSKELNFNYTVENSIELKSKEFPENLKKFFGFSIVYNEEIKICVMQIRENIKSYKNISFNENKIIESFANILLTETNKIIEKVIYTEKEIYFDYLQQNEIEKLKNYLARKYIELNKIVINNLKTIQLFVFSIFENLNNNFQSLNLTFGYSNILTSFEMKGDKHNNGQRVCFLNFEGNKIVYKPRTMNQEILFFELCNQINKLLNNYDLKTYKILSFKKFSFSEFIVNKECIDILQVNKFYENAGKILFLLYLLNAKDLHFENIISNSENLFIIDLECIFYNPTFRKNRFVIEELLTSLLTTGLLPTQIELKENEYVEIGALSKISENEISVESNVVENKENDLILENKKHTITSQNNLPIFNNQEIVIDEFFNEIISGFTKSYNVFLKNKDIFLDLIEKNIDVNNLKLRHLVRPTPVYSHLNDLSLYPEYLYTKKLRKVALFNLSYNFIKNKNDIKVLKSEISDLLNNSVPAFYTFLNNNKLLNNNIVIASNYFRNTSYEYWQKKVNLLSIKDLNFQISLINKLKNANFRKTDNYRLFSKKLHPFNIEKIIRKDIYFGNKKIAIIDYLHLNDKSVVKPLNYDIYNGYSGILLFYINLFKTYNKKIFRNISYLIFKKIISFIKKGEFNYCGFYSGTGGLIYTLIEFYNVFHDERSIKYASELSKQENFDNTYFDLMYGLPGYLISLQKIYKLKKDNILKNIINKNIIKVFEFLENKIKNINYKDFSFSHGVSGVIYSLIASFDLLEINQKENLIKIFNQFITSVKHFYLRQQLDFENYISNWCNSEIGILLFYLKSCKKLQIKKDKELVKVLNIIILKYGFGNNHSLCHGDASFLEIQSIISEELFNKYYKLLKIDVLENGIKCGNINNLNSLGLMVGISGIGYEILKLKNKSIPSILLPE